MGQCLSKPDVIEVKEIEVVKGHERNMSNHYIVQYPDHEPRKPTAIYNKTHKALKGSPCFICGVRGIGIETHHFYCEKAAQNAIDWEVFGEFAKTCYNIQTGENIGNFDWAEVAKNPDIFVDSPYNMITFCYIMFNSNLFFNNKK